MMSKIEILEYRKEIEQKYNRSNAELFKMGLVVIDKILQEKKN